MASKYDTVAIKTFDNEVVEVLFENQLSTRLDMERFAHADYSLAEAPGMIKKVRKYKGSGSVEELTMGNGNSGVFGSSFDETPYEVGVTQGKGQYYDEQIMNDPDAVEAMINFMSTDMVNDLRGKIVTELGKGSLAIKSATFSFNDVADAIAALPEESTENEGLFLLVNRKDVAAWRKNLKSDLSYVEAFVRTGYIGTVCGVPMYWSDIVPEGEAYLATPEAVTIFVKKGVEVETKREPDTRSNEVYIRKVMLVALTNENKVVKITTAA